MELENITRREFIMYAVLVCISGCKKTFRKNYPHSSIDPELEKEYQKVLAKLPENPREGALEIIDSKIKAIHISRLEEELYYKIVDKFPSSSNAHFLMGNVYFINIHLPDNIEKSIVHYSKAIKLDPTFAAAYIQRGIVTYYKIYENHVITTADIYYQELPDDVKETLKEAIGDFDSAIELQPRLFSAHYNKGVVLIRLGRKSEAITCFDRVIKIGHEVIPLGRLSIAQEHRTQYICGGEPMCIMSALARYAVETRGSKIVAGQRIVHIGPSWTYISNKDDPLAFAYYHRATCHVEPNMAPDSVQKRVQMAIDDFNQAIKLNPNVPEFYKQLAIAYQYAGDSAKSSEIQQKARILKNKIDNMMRKK